MGSLPSYKASLCLCNPCYAAGFPGISSMRLPEYLICNCRNTLVSKTIYTKIKSQKKSKLQLFLLGALQDVQLNWFQRVCMCWFEFFPKKTAPLSTAKLNTSLGSGYGGCKRQKVNSLLWLLPANSCSSHPSPPKSPTSRRQQAFSSPCEPMTRLAPRRLFQPPPEEERHLPGGAFPSRRRGEPRLSIAAGGKPGGSS